MRPRSRKGRLACNSGSDRQRLEGVTLDSFGLAVAQVPEGRAAPVSFGMLV